MIDINNIIKLLDKSLDIYHNQFVINNARYMEKFKENPVFLYEPTLATYCSTDLKEYLRKNYGDLFFASEYNVPVSLSEETQACLKKQVNNSKGKSSWKKCISTHMHL